MPDDVETRLSLLRSRQQEASRRHAQTEAKLDQVVASKNQLLESLKSKGFSTPEQAREHIAALKSQTETILADIEAKIGTL